MLLIKSINKITIIWLKKQVVIYNKTWFSNVNITFKAIIISNSGISKDILCNLLKKCI